MLMDHDDVVVKSNALVEAAYSLTVAETKLVLAAIAQVRRDEPITDEIRYTVTANALADMGGFAANHEHRALKQAADRLLGRLISIIEKPNGSGRRPRVLRTHWVQSVVYRDDEGAVDLRFAKDVIPYLNQLTAEFSQYKLTNVAGMTSSYGVRLYELLIQWRSKGEREVEVAWLRRVFQIEGKYKSIRDLKRWVIEPAVRDVNEHSDLQVNWGQRKLGRSVAFIQFKFGPKPSSKLLAIPAAAKPRKQDEGELIAGIPRHVIDQHARPGESYSMAAQRLHKMKREGVFSW
ncbi:replication initiation protein [Halomonas citrativorans]|uniref:replication initiation protein n=1 Tax=Halomonas TaxID=2745 RepID=UPI001D012A65|nr:replication initiation protein [Halomonas citrativorans]